MDARISSPHATAAAIGRLVDMLHAAKPSSRRVLRSRTGSVSLDALAEELDIALDRLGDADGHQETTGWDA
jgi:hypothetical protein